MTPAFDAAFEQLDREDGGDNFVSLVDLRRKLAGFDRQTFDGQLRELRIARRYTLIGAQGRAGGLTEAELAAGIRENGRLLLYVSRL